MMNKIRFLLIASILLIYPIIDYGIEQKTDPKKEAVKNPAGSETNPVKKEDELARVSIIPFEDRTKSANFQYMSESLGDAINSSMIKDFSYNRIDTKDVKKSVFDMQQEIIKDKIKDKDKPAKKRPARKKEEAKKETAAGATGKEKKDTKEKQAKATVKGVKDNGKEKVELEKREKTDEEWQQDEDQLNLVKMVAKNLNSDIVIYGNYFYDNETNELVFTVTLYLALSDAVKELDETRNVVDNTIFKATDKVSKNLVAEIHTMIEEAEKIAAEKKGQKTDTAKEEKKDEKKKPGEKIALTKKVAMTATPEWSNKKFSISLLPGFYMNNLPNKGCGACQVDLSLAARFWVIPNLYLGLALNAGGIDMDNFPFYKTKPLWSVFDGIAFVGLSIPVNRWLFSVDAGGGYYVLVDKTKKLYYDPAFAARLGVEVLLSDSFSMGLSVNAHMYYDKPTPLYFGGLALSLNFAM